MVSELPGPAVLVLFKPVVPRADGLSVSGYDGLSPTHRFASVWLRVSFAVFLAVAVGLLAHLFVPPARPVDGLAGLLLLAFLGWQGWRICGANVTTTPQGIRVRNVLSTRTLAWTEVRGFKLQQSGGGRIAVIQLAGGESIRASAIQDTAFHRPNSGAQHLVDELNGELARRRTPSAPTYPAAQSLW